MSDFFDNMCRVLATPMSRSKAMKLIVGGIGGAILAPFAFGAPCPADHVCAGVNKDNCCPGNQVCCGTTKKVCCPSGFKCCGGATCCQMNTTCGPATNGTKCCTKNPSGNLVCP